MIIQPNLLKAPALAVSSRVFVCGAGYASGNIIIRDTAREALQCVPSVKAIYGEEIEAQHSYRNIGTDLQTLEARFAHDVDFTLLILESPGSIAELGAFTLLPAIRDRLVVLLSDRFYRAESYIARGPLSFLTQNNPNSVIYFNTDNLNDMIDRVRYPLTFYKYAHHLRGYEYLKNTRRPFQREAGDYADYIKPIRERYEMAITLIAILVGDRVRYADLLLLSGLAPKQLTRSLSKLFTEKKIEKVGSGRYRTTEGYGDELLSPFSSTAISKLRATVLAAA